MTEIEPSGQEPDALTSEQLTVEIVHSAGNWRLAVRANGSVEASNQFTPTTITQWTTADKERVAARENHRIGKTIEDILARYAHETETERSAEEHGAALRDGIIDALCSTVTNAECGRDECDHRAAYVRHVSAPTGPRTTLVCDECATGGRYITLHALANVREQEGEL